MGLGSIFTSLFNNWKKDSTTERAVQEDPIPKVMQHYRGYVLYETDNQDYAPPTCNNGIYSYKGAFLCDPERGVITPVFGMPKIIVYKLHFAQEAMKPFSEQDPALGVDHSKLTYEELWDQLNKEEEYAKACVAYLGEKTIHGRKRPSLQSWQAVYADLCKHMSQRGIAPVHLNQFDTIHALNSFHTCNAATLTFRTHPDNADKISKFARNIHDRFGVDGCNRPKPEVFCRNDVAKIYMGCGG